MTNLKDQLQEKIRKEREGSEKAGQSKRKSASDARSLLDEIRPRLDELPHTTDKYSLNAEYALGPYANDIALVELYESNGAWVARWEIAPTVSGTTAKWEVTYNPRGVETYHEWFRNDDDLFKYLTASIAERVVEMDAD